MAAALRQAPITFQSRFPPSVGSSSPKPLAFSFSRGLRLNFTLKIAKKYRSRRGGALAATMYGIAVSSYAFALEEIANTSTENLEAFAYEVGKPDQIFSDPEISFFTSPIVLDEDKFAVIEEIASTANFQPGVKNFLNVLIDSDRIDVIRDILNEFDLKYNEIIGTEMAVVTLESQPMA